MFRIETANYVLHDMDFTKAFFAVVISWNLQITRQCNFIYAHKKGTCLCSCSFAGNLSATLQECYRITVSLNKHGGSGVA